MAARPPTRIVVRRRIGDPCRGDVLVGPVGYPCALGRGGFVVAKREGDGGTPVSRLPLRQLWWRGDRLPRPRCTLPARRITAQDAWCDDVADRRYNRPIRGAGEAAEERLARADDLYDVIVELGWNDRPVRRGRGSAIFWHVARPGLSPTAGCVAMTRTDLIRLLPRLSRRAVLICGPVAQRPARTDRDRRGAHG